MSFRQGVEKNTAFPHHTGGEEKCTACSSGKRMKKNKKNAEDNEREKKNTKTAQKQV